MLETVRGESLGPGYTLVASRARVSSVNGRWAVADVGGTGPAGDQLQGARYIFRRSDPATLDWRTVTLGSSIGGCRVLDALGVPARVIDDLKASNEVSYSCANPPPTAVPCLVTSRSGWFSVARRRPTRCDLSLSGDDQPSFAALARLRALRWSRVTATSAVAVGAALPNHAPFDPYRVRVRFSGWTEAWCGPQFTRAIVTTRYGTSSGPLSYGACPRRP